MIRENERFLSQLYALVDFSISFLVFLLAWWIKFRSGLVPNSDFLPTKTYMFWGLINAFILLFISSISQLYSPKRKKNFNFEWVKVVQVNVVSILLLIACLYILREVDISRSFLMMFLCINIISINFYRYIIKISLRYIRQKGYNRQFLLIIGAGTLGKRFYDNLLVHPELGFEVLGFLDDFHDDKEGPKPVLGKIDELETILSKILVDEVIIALPLYAHEKLPNLINVCEKFGVKVQIIPDYFDILPSKPYFDNFGGIPLINVREVPLDVLRNRSLKRLFDILFSLTAIVITLPLLILIATGVKLTSKGPIIFKQVRVGLNRRNFNMYKFRSMRVLPEGVDDRGWTVKNDPRKTKFGSFIRKTSLDELPQFFNVLMGHMSVVGPRPERPFFVDQFKDEIPKYMVKHYIRPGITGWAQASGLRGDTSIEDRIKYDIFYIENWSFTFDIRIIIKTIYNGFFNKNAY